MTVALPHLLHRDNNKQLPDATPMPPQKFAKGSISNRDVFEEVRTMNKLHALHAKGAILNKRDWWIKWTTMPEVRTKWLREIQETLVRAHVAHVWSEWPNRDSLTNDFHDVAPLLEITAMDDEADKANAIDAILSHVIYPPSYDRYGPFAEGKLYEDADSVVDKRTSFERESLDEPVFDKAFLNVFAEHKGMRPFCQISWYVAMMIVREQLRVLPPQEWAGGRVTQLLHQIWSSESHEVINRTRQLVLAVLRDGECTTEVLRKHLLHENRPTVLKLLECHFAKIRAVLDAAQASIERDLEILVNKLHLAAHGRGQESMVYTPGPAPRTWLSDNCIDAELKAKFKAEIAILENVSEKLKDWHPNSNDQVLNLVHPSLFCGVVGETKVLAADKAGDLQRDPATHMKAIMFAKPERFLRGPSRRPSMAHGGSYDESDFQWLPCEIDVAEGGESAHIRTYINNLHPEDHETLYGSIESIFSRFVPLFDQVLSTLVYPQAAPVYRPEPQYTLAGSRCQVIVKIAEIVLTPEKSSYNGGSWHIEGTRNENIVATGLYYFGCENITESRLSFCTFVQQPEYEQSDDIGVALSYGLHNEKALVQNMGSVIAMEDRCVVFPNILHHKVEPFELADPTKPGMRKILAFFLVNPTMDPIPSTAIVPPQQEEWVKYAQEPTLKKLRVPETVLSQIQEMGRDRMALEQAKATRLELMEERSTVTLDAVALDDYDDDAYFFSLCEH